MDPDTRRCLCPIPRAIEPRLGRCAVGVTEPRVRVDPAAVPHAEGYRLSLAPDRIDITAHDAAGAFYAGQTLRQLRRLAALPGGDGRATCCVIDDHPDLPERGLMLDISRDRVPTMPDLFALVDRLAELKFNRLQLYTEHTFAYPGHETVWRDASPMTAKEVRALEAYCADRFISLIPNQNCFGHMERWLTRDAYRHLAECTGGFTRNDLPEPFFYPRPTTLNPLDPASLALVGDLLDKLLPHFSAREINVGCDETFDLGKGRSAAACAVQGRGRVYLGFLQKVHTLCRARGVRMQYWADIALRHPALLPELPRDATALCWGYERDHDFDTPARALSAAGLPFQVCPSTATFVSIHGRHDVARANTRAAMAAAAAHDARGSLCTWWGDFGHRQAPACNDPGLLYAAAGAWCRDTEPELDEAAVLNVHIHGDAADRIGEAILTLGRVTEDLGHDAHLLGWTLIRDDAPLRFLDDGRAVLQCPWGPTPPFDAAQLDAVLQRVDRVLAMLALSDPHRADGDLTRAELRTTAMFTAHAARNLRARLTRQVPAAGALDAAARAELADDLQHTLADFRANWRARSRPGGLADSTASLERILHQYRDASEPA